MSIESLINKGFAFKVTALSTVTMIPNFLAAYPLWLEIILSEIDESRVYYLISIEGLISVQL